MLDDIESEEFNKLTDPEKQAVIDFIEKNIQMTFTETHCFNTEIKSTDSGMITLEDGERQDFIENEFKEYYCDSCHNYIGKDGKIMVFHVIKHLNLLK